MQIVNMGLSAYVLGNITMLTTQIDQSVLEYRGVVSKVAGYLKRKVIYSTSVNSIGIFALRITGCLCDHQTLFAPGKVSLGITLRLCDHHTLFALGKVRMVALGIALRICDHQTRFAAGIVALGTALCLCDHQTLFSLGIVALEIILRLCYHQPLHCILSNTLGFLKLFCVLCMLALRDGDES